VAVPRSRLSSARGSLPVLGHIPYLAADPLGFLADQSRHGAVVRLRIGKRSVYLVTTPHLARKILANEQGCL
jgi:hypothetical protein